MREIYVQSKYSQNIFTLVSWDVCSASFLLCHFIISLSSFNTHYAICPRIFNLDFIYIVECVHHCNICIPSRLASLRDGIIFESCEGCIWIKIQSSNTKQDIYIYPNLSSCPEAQAQSSSEQHPLRMRLE